MGFFEALFSGVMRKLQRLCVFVCVCYVSVNKPDLLLLLLTPKRLSDSGEAKDGSAALLRMWLFKSG